jgi:hypothetical protein
MKLQYAYRLVKHENPYETPLERDFAYYGRDPSGPYWEAAVWLPLSSGGSLSFQESLCGVPGNCRVVVAPKERRRGYPNGAEVKDTRITPVKERVEVISSGFNPKIRN